MLWLIYLALGLVAGVLAGLFGVGGGVILVPAFLALFQWQGISPEVITHLAIGSSLACIIFSAASSVWTHHQKGSVLWSVLLRMVPGIMVGAWLGVGTAVQIPSSTLQLIIGVFLILMAIKLLLKVELSQERQAQLPGSVGLFSVGGLIGWVSGIFGIGGGTLTVPFLQHFGARMQKAIATSSACGLPIALVGAISNMYFGWGQENLPEGAVGYVFIPAVLAVVVTSMPGAKLGALLAHRLPAAQLKKYFGVFLALMGAHIIYKMTL